MIIWLVSPLSEKDRKTPVESKARLLIHRQTLLSPALPTEVKLEPKRTQFNTNMTVRREGMGRPVHYRKAHSIL